MWEDEHASAEAGDEPSRGIELEQRRDGGSVAGRSTATLEHPDRLAVTVDVDTVGCPEFPAARELPEVFDLVWIRKIVGYRLGRLSQRMNLGDRERRRQR